MVVLPTINGMLADAVPEGTPVPFTVTVAVGSSTVGVTVRVLTAFTTLSVNVVGTVLPFARPALVLSENSASSGERGRLTTAV